MFSDDGYGRYSDVVEALEWCIATRIDGDPLTYSIVDNPSHGNLSGAAPSVTYTPETGYTGGDSFTFKANDSKADSNVATVFITVNPTAQTMHVASIEMTLVERYRGWNYYAEATVTIVDANNNSVEGATVSGHWERATTDSDSGVTDVNGEVTLQSNSIWRASGKTFTFCVDDVTKEGWNWIDSPPICNSVTVP